MQKTAKIKIEGTKPLLFHAFKEETLTQKRGTKSGSSGNNPEEWKTSVLMDEERKLYLLPPYFFAPLKDGAKYSKVGKGNLSKKLTATLVVQGNKIYIEDRVVPEEGSLTRDETAPVYLDVRSVVNPVTKGRNLRYRIACCPGWKCEFVIEWDDSIISKENMIDILRDAGALSGTGSGRSLGFGRFTIKDFQIIS